MVVFCKSLPYWCSVWLHWLRHGYKYRTTVCRSTSNEQLGTGNGFLFPYRWRSKYSTACEEYYCTLLPVVVLVLYHTTTKTYSSTTTLLASSSTLNVLGEQQCNTHRNSQHVSLTRFGLDIPTPLYCSRSSPPSFRRWPTNQLQRLPSCPNGKCSLTFSVHIRRGCGKKSHNWSLSTVRRTRSQLISLLWPSTGNRFPHIVLLI